MSIPPDIDWTQSNGQIAKRYDVSPATARSWRRKCGAPPLPSCVAATDWSAIDWELSNNQITKRYGLNFNAVRKWRRVFRSTSSPLLLPAASASSATLPT